MKAPTAAMKFVNNIHSRLVDGAGSCSMYTLYKIAVLSATRQDFDEFTLKQVCHGAVHIISPTLIFRTVV